MKKPIRIFSFILVLILPSQFLGLYVKSSGHAKSCKPIQLFQKAICSSKAWPNSVTKFEKWGMLSIGGTNQQ